MAISNLLSADIFRRLGLATTCSMHYNKALSILKKWGADYIVEKLAKDMETFSSEEEEEDNPVNNVLSSDSVIVTSNGGGSTTSGTTPFGSGTMSQLQTRRQRDGPNFAAILSTAIIFLPLLRLLNSLEDCPPLI